MAPAQRDKSGRLRIFYMREGVETLYTVIRHLTPQEARRKGMHYLQIGYIVEVYESDLREPYRMIPRSIIGDGTNHAAA